MTLTHDATDLILPGGANITTAAGDEAEFIEYATGDYRCTNYSKASGEGVIASGKVLQVVTYQYAGAWSTTSTTFVDTNLSVNITPASTDNKILIMITCGIAPGADSAWGTIERTVGVTETNLGGATEGFSGWSSGVSIGNISYLDSPSTTSEATYKFQIRSGGGGTIEASYAGSGQQSIIVIEVEG